MVAPILFRGRRGAKKEKLVAPIEKTWSSFLMLFRGRR